MPNLLISPRIQSLFGPRIAAAANGQLDIKVSSLANPLDDEQAAQIEVAYMSLDVLRTAQGKAPPINEFTHFADLFRRAPNLKMLHLGIAGADNAVYQQLMARGVHVTTSSGANAQAVAHTAIAGLMGLARGVLHWTDTQRRHVWAPMDGPLTPRDLPGQHLTVVGLGPIGLEIARLAKALGLTVTGVRRSATPALNCDEVVTFEDMHSVLPKTDWLVLACPLTDITRKLVDAKALDALPNGARVINVGRGGVVVDADLLRALQSGKLASAYCDVFEVEPLPADSPLWDAPNLLMSTHTAGRTNGAEERSAQMFVDNVKHHLAQTPLINEVRAKAG